MSNQTLAESPGDLATLAERKGDCITPARRPSKSVAYLGTDGDALVRHALDLYRDSRGRLVFTGDDGQRHIGVEPVRAFPISDPDCHISLVDPHGRELFLVQDLADLPAGDRQILVQMLTEREFLPRIERVIHIARNKEPHVWDVETDRGTVQFLMREDDIRRLGPTRAILVDMHGVRYYIADSRQLDAKSRRYLSQYL